VIPVQDPIRNALRQLVREKQIDGWSVRQDEREGSIWTVNHTEIGTVTYTTDEVNGLIAMFWEAA
jgi:hypothetical protein